MGLTEDEKLWIESTNKALNDKLEKSLYKQFSERFDNMRKEVDDLKQENQDFKQENKTLRQRLIENDIRVDNLEQYGRRMNLRIEGLPWREGETVDDLQRRSSKKWGNRESC